VVDGKVDVSRLAFMRCRIAWLESSGLLLPVVSRYLLFWIIYVTSILNFTVPIPRTKPLDAVLGEKANRNTTRQT
jgi:hypothetical protein